MAKTTNQKTTQPTIEDIKPKCFVIMPFGGWFDKYFLDLLFPYSNIPEIHRQNTIEQYNARHIFHLII